VLIQKFEINLAKNFSLDEFNKAMETFSSAVNSLWIILRAKKGDLANLEFSVSIKATVKTVEFDFKRKNWKNEILEKLDGLNQFEDLREVVFFDLLPLSIRKLAEFLNEVCHLPQKISVVFFKGRFDNILTEVSYPTIFIKSANVILKVNCRKVKIRSHKKKFVEFRKDWVILYSYAPHELEGIHLITKIKEDEIPESLE
jgi:hypothetical protein